MICLAAGKAAAAMAAAAERHYLDALKLDPARLAVPRRYSPVRAYGASKLADLLLSTVVGELAPLELPEVDLLRRERLAAR